MLSGDMVMSIECMEACHCGILLRFQSYPLPLESAFNWTTTREFRCWLSGTRCLKKFTLTANLFSKERGG